MLMQNEYLFNEELGIASIQAKSDWHNIAVHTLMQNSKKKQPSINAYLGARYSRSADSIVKIAKEILDAGIDASARLEAIFQGYGHKSVGDMAELFVCIENVPMLSAMRAFNVNPVLSGQERSTRFQNFANPDFVTIPDANPLSKGLKSRYSQIMNQSMQNYIDLKEQTESTLAKHFLIDKDDKKELSALQARSFDTLRYFIPLGVKTSFALVMSARSWSEYISRLSGSPFVVDREIASLLTELLGGSKELVELGYSPEADNLIRHTEPNSSRDVVAHKIQEALKLDLDLTKLNYAGKAGRGFEIMTGVSPVQNLVQNYVLSLNPNVDPSVIKFDTNVIRKISEIINEFHHHNNQIGNVGQSCSYLIDGFADHGILKDLNRHRSFERYIPLWETFTSIKSELDRPTGELFNLCNYLEIPELSELKTEYKLRFIKTYEQIQKWVSDAYKESPATAEEYGRYLLPHGHKTRYRFYASIDDLQYTINLRTRPGGHIAYRSLTDSWLDTLSDNESYWKPLRNKLERVSADNRVQFINRS